MHKKILLGVNIDHIATVRQARGTTYPSPLYAALEAEMAGADGITLHLREDLRHIQKDDVLLIKKAMQTRMNLELAVTEKMLNFAEQIMPEHACFVPEKREELTTEGGLDVITNFDKVKEATQRLQDKGIEVSLFIDPDLKQLDAAAATGAKAIELHTGAYADAKTKFLQESELSKIRQAATHAANLKLIVNAGHGLHYHNVQPIAGIIELNELNIGHAIIAQALFVGMKNAVLTMQKLMQDARG